MLDLPTRHKHRCDSSCQSSGLEGSRWVVAMFFLFGHWRKGMWNSRDIEIFCTIFGWVVSFELSQIWENFEKLDINMYVGLFSLPVVVPNEGLVWDPRAQKCKNILMVTIIGKGDNPTYIRSSQKDCHKNKISILTAHVDRVIWWTNPFIWEMVGWVPYNTVYVQLCKTFACFFYFFKCLFHIINLKPLEKTDWSL